MCVAFLDVSDVLYETGRVFIGPSALVEDYIAGLGEDETAGICGAWLRGGGWRLGRAAELAGVNAVDGGAVGGGEGGGEGAGEGFGEGGEWIYESWKGMKRWHC